MASIARVLLLLHSDADPRAYPNDSIAQLRARELQDALCRVDWH